MFLPSGALTTNLRIPGLGGGPSHPRGSGVWWAVKGEAAVKGAQGQAMQTTAGKQNISKQTKQQRINSNKKLMQILNVNNVSAQNQTQS